MAADGSVIIEITGDASEFEQSLDKAANTGKKSISEYRKDVMLLAHEYKKQGMSMQDAMKKAYSEIDKSQYEATEGAREFGEASLSAVDALSSALAAAGVAAALKEIADALKACVDASIEFESAMTGVFKTVDGTTKQLSAISDGIQQMSTEIPATTTEIAAVAEAAGQLGIQTDNVLDFTRVMIDLGESTNLSADEAATAFARFANITGTAADDYSRLGSTVVGLGNNFATTEAEITQMATRLASAGTLAGLTESEIFALAAAMSSVGIEAEAGGTAMTQTLSAIETAVANGGDELKAFADIAGMSSEEFASAWESNAIGAIQAFIGGLSELEGEGESAVLILDELGLSGVRQSNMIQSLALASDKLSQAVDLANTAWEENTALSDEAGKRYETLESRLAMTRNALTNVEIAIGNALTPALGQLADAGTSAFTWAAEFIEENPWLVQAITAVVAGLAALTAGIAAMSVVSKLTSMVQGATGAISALNIVLSSNPAIAVAAAITTLVTAIALLSEESNEATKAQEEFTESVEQNREAYEDTASAIDSQRSSVSALSRSLEDLMKVESKSETDKQLILATVEQLNAAVPALALAYDSETDALTQAGNAASLTADELIELAEAQLYADEMANKAKRAAQIRQEREEIEAEIDLLTQKLEEAKAAYADAQSGFSTSFTGETAASRSAWSDILDYEEAIRGFEDDLASLNEEYNLIYTEIDEYQQKQQEASAATEEAGTVQEQYENILAETKTQLEEIAQEYNELYESIKSSFENQFDLFDQATQVTSASYEEMMAAQQSQLEYWNSYQSSVDNLIGRNIEGMDTLIASFSDGSAESAAALETLSTRSDEELAALITAMDETSTASDDAASTIADAMLNTQGQIQETVDSAITKISELDMSVEMQQAGLDTLQGYINGLDMKSGALYAKISSIMSTAIATAKAELSEASPSKKFMTIGEDTLNGYIIGVENKHDAVKDTMKEAGELIIESFPDEEMQEQAEALLDHYEEFWDEYVSQTQDYADDLQDVLDDVTDKWDDVVKEQEAMTDKLAEYGGLLNTDAQLSFGNLMTTKLTGFTQEGQRIDTPVLEDLQEQIDALKQYGETMDALRARGISESLMSEILTMNTEDALTYSNLLLEQSDEAWSVYMQQWEERQALLKQNAGLSDLQQQINDLTRYGEALDALKARGISESLMSEVLAMSTEDALTYSEGLLNQSDEDWDAYMQQWEEKQDLAQRIASDYYAEELELLETEYSDKLEAGMDGLKDISYNAGLQTMEGLLEGLRAKESEVYAAAESIANAIQSAFTTSMEMNSPSKWMRDEVGKMIPAGIAIGMDDGSDAAISQAQSMAKRIQDAASIQPDVMAAQGEIMAQLKSAVESEVLRFSADLALSSNVQHEAKRAARSGQAVETAGLLAAATATSGQTEAVINLNGIEVGRAILNDLRAVEDQSPRIVSD